MFNNGTKGPFKYPIIVYNIRYVLSKILETRNGVPVQLTSTSVVCGRLTPDIK
jgi:hypothetical protein